MPTVWPWPFKTGKTRKPEEVASSRTAASGAFSRKQRNSSFKTWRTATAARQSDAVVAVSCGEVMTLTFRLRAASSVLGSAWVPPVMISTRTPSRMAIFWISQRSPTMTQHFSGGNFSRRAAKDSKPMAPIIKINSSSRSVSKPTISCPSRVCARPSREDSTSRVFAPWLTAGKRNLLNLNRESRPRHFCSSSITGRMRRFLPSIRRSASAAVAPGGTLKIRRCMTSEIFGETSATNFGAGIPKVSSTKSIRSLVSPQRAATASSRPVRRLNSA